MIRCDRTTGETCAAQPPSPSTHLDASLRQLQSRKQASRAAAHDHNRLSCCPAALDAASRRGSSGGWRLLLPRLLLLALQDAGALLQPPQACCFKC